MTERELRIGSRVPELAVAADKSEEMVTSQLRVGSAVELGKGG
jgi:hypothetical protein